MQDLARLVGMAVCWRQLGRARRREVLRPGRKRSQKRANPFEYLLDLFTRLPGNNIQRLEEFLPDHWLAAVN
ncbi:transposase domain-containing protein [bacterium]|nr:transposase domain-containing protein [bacterium]